MSDPEPDLERLEALFQAAADIAPERRAAFLDQRCADAPELRRRIEALLAEHDRGDSLLSPLAGADGEVSISEGPGTVIDRYKLLQKIGEGGFGVVYMAEQEQPIRRKVALKIIKLGMDTREVVARFEAERQALALMDHPNIARVLDGGTTETGRPYFVMELVRGISITEYADDDRLTTRERLELVVQVCQAVQHAHQKGVIHRDIKPSNVLVTMNDGKPMPKVIDFGIAKAMHTRLTEKTLFTQFQRFIGTPAYMSPEQAELSALDVDTRTDIYALGVLLYELLTGSTPFDTSTLLQAGIAEVQRVIREQPPERPSLRISTSGDAALATRRNADLGGLTRALRGDLDWIVMRCLEKERSRRYSTASELAADLQRHLEGLPVLAGPPSALYRLRKFVARNRVAVISGAVVLIAVVDGFAVTWFALREASVQRDDAVAAREEALEERNAALGVTEFLVDTLALADPGVALDPDVPVRAVLDRTAARVPDAFGGQPWAEARVRAAIGRAYQTMGEQELAEGHLRRAIELYRSPDGVSSERFPPEEVFRTAWALTHLCFNLERSDAFEMAELARRVALGHVGATHAEVAEAFQRLTDRALETDERRLAEVPRLFEESIRISERDLAPDDPLWEIVAELYAWTGYSFWYSPDEPISAPIWRRSYEILCRVLPDGDPRPGEVLGQLVTVLNRAGRADEAEAELRTAIGSMRRALGDDAYQVAFCESMLGESLVQQGRYAEAEPLLLASHGVLQRLHKPTGFMTVDSMSRLARLYEAWGRPDEHRRWGQAIVDATAAGAMAMPWPIARHAFAGTDPAFQAALDRAAGLVGEGALPEVDDPAVADAVRDVLALRDEVLAGDRDRAIVLGRYLALWSTRIAPGALDATRRAMTVAALEVLRSLEERFPLDVADLLARRCSLEEDARRARGLAREAWEIVRRTPEDCDWYTVMPRARIARAIAGEGLVDEALQILYPSRRVLEAQLCSDNSLTREVDGLIAELERGTTPAPDAPGE